ncbi:MAG: hypothetical protein AAF903_06710, partial [Pseudomonadota bacterium]
PFGAGLDGAMGFALTMAVDRLELNYLQEPGLLVAVCEVSAVHSSPLVRYDGEGKEVSSAHGLTLYEVMVVKDALRRLYPPFFSGFDRHSSPTRADWFHHLFPTDVAFSDTNAERLCEKPSCTLWHSWMQQPDPTPSTFNGGNAAGMMDDLRDHGHLPIVSWWKQAFGRVTSWQVKDEPLLQQIVDERMPTFSFVALRYGEEGLREGDLARLCFADGPGKGLPHAADFMPDFMENHAYTRHSHMGTDFLVSSYATTMIVRTGARVAEAKRAGFDFALDILQEHYRRHYTRMVMLAYVQKAGLLAFSNWVSRAMTDWGSLRSRAYRATVDDLRRGFAEFNQIVSFSNVSNQEQPRELFALHSRHLQIGELRTEISDELDRARAVLSEIDAERQAEGGILINTIVTIFAVLGLPLALVGAIAAYETEYGKDMLVKDGALKFLDGEKMFSVSIILLVLGVAIAAPVIFQSLGAWPRGSWRKTGQFVLNLFNPYRHGSGSTLSLYLAVLAAFLGLWTVVFWG